MSKWEQKNGAGLTTRRTFLNRLWIFLGLAGLAEFAWLGVSFLGARRDRDRPEAAERIVTVGEAASFKPGTVTPVPQGRFYLARLADGGFLALSRTCTHLGCSVPWDEDKHLFVCPCHGSSFSLTGEVLTGPAPRPLDTFAVRIEDGVVKVDCATPRRRDRFRAEQAVRL
ncbi:Rieske (2Fe-2S) iron-sulfur domain-containing protein [Pseudodesulfovibrio mercurii]|uniref:Rieske (2Fe-2S) iron-sulfur domain-containing protein n=1 Tax=Pseudodesulfovibrio mercurii TaxID=641491 RepID=F0JGP0_9BACT|nr:Rieske (2Fe-2S) protein [Pseudodesulfovibrio mercurii]EGB13909.1 Rieske (2Fe-2S) iron-sulfur domain-containing protein [Pseudodesulfovibrio mercurii]